MEEDTDEEFYEASCVSDNEYLETETNLSSIRNENVAHSDDSPNPVENTKPEIHNPKLNCADSLASLGGKESRNDDNEDANDGILDAILNEEDLKKIYIEDMSIPNNFWSFIHNNLPNHDKASKQVEDSLEGDMTLSTMEEEVKELEMEIEQMFNTSAHELKVPENSPSEEPSSGEDTNGIYHSPIPSNRKISLLPFPSKEKMYSRTLHISCLPKVDLSLEQAQKEPENCNFKKTFKSSIQSISSRSSTDPDFLSDRGSLTDSEEVVDLTKKDSSKALPVQSVEILPKLVKEPVKSKVKKMTIEENLLKAETLLERANFFEINEAKTCYPKKRPKSRIQREFTKVRSFIVNTECSKKVQKNASKSFHLDRLTNHKISATDHSGSRLNLKAARNTQTPEKKSKTKDTKKIKNDKLVSNNYRKNNRAMNTAKTKKRNFCCQKMGAFIDSTNFCSITLTLESAHANVKKEDLMSSLKDYFWFTESNKERALLQLVILCMENNFLEIQIATDKFRLYCQNEFSTCSIAKSEKESEEEVEDTFRSNLICQPLYIETIQSQSQVNRLGLESKFEDSCSSGSRHVMKRTIKETVSCVQEEDKEKIR